MNRHSPRPRDTNQLAITIVDIATGQVEDGPVTVSGRAAGGRARFQTDPCATAGNRQGGCQ